MAEAANSNTGTPTCPFCQHAVARDLIAFGGQCPHCFGEIPGEETPTDPGEAKKAQHEKEFKQEAKKVGNSRLLPVLLVSLIVLIPSATAAYLLLKPVDPLPTLILDDETFDYSTAAVAYTQPEDKPVAGKKPIPHAPTNPTAKPDAMAYLAGKPVEPGGTPNMADLIKSGPEAAEAGPSIHKAGVTEVGKLQGMAAAGTSEGPSLSGLDIETKVSREFQAGVTLTDDNQIVDMAKRIVKENQPRLRPCVERKMKLDPEFHGKWNLNFTVTPKGQVEGVTVEGRGVSDAEFEQCLIGYVQGWRFQPIKQPLPIAKLLSFGG
jgi:hypothetical protein